jgi:hypothetical protein
MFNLFSEGGRLGGLSSIVHLSNGSGAPTIAPAAPATAPAIAPAPAPATGLSLGSQQARDEAIRLAIDNMAKAKEPVSPEIDYLKLGQRFFNAASVPSGRKTALGDIGAFLVNSGAMYGEEYDTAKAAALKKQAAQESKAVQDFNTAAKLEQLGIERDKLVTTREEDARKAGAAAAKRLNPTPSNQDIASFIQQAIAGLGPQNGVTVDGIAPASGALLASEQRVNESVVDTINRLRRTYPGSINVTQNGMLEYNPPKISWTAKPASPQNQ